MRSKFRRLVNLYKLIWGPDWIDFLREEAARARSESAALRGEITAMRAELAHAQSQQGVQARSECAALHSEVAAMREELAQAQSQQAAAEAQLASLHTWLARREELDYLKSSLEVPREWSAEFNEWKQQHPVPAQPLVSVCVATYNRAQLLLERCLPSIFAQTYDHFELIVVGDGCTDETAARLAEVRDARLRFVNLPKRGDYPSDPMRRWMVAGTQAVNHAMRLVRGDYVTHLDDDDEHLPERLEKLVAFATAQECDFVWHPFWTEVAPAQWVLFEGHEFALGQVTTSAVFYRSWLTRIEWNVDAHWLREPGDWNRFRRFKYLEPVMKRYPEPLLRHYRERNQRG
jgi:hypothetical protein